MCVFIAYFHRLYLLSIRRIYITSFYIYLTAMLYPLPLKKEKEFCKLFILFSLSAFFSLLMLPPTRQCL